MEIVGGQAAEESGVEVAKGGEMGTLVRQQRIVVRTMYMGLVVADIQASMDRVAFVAAGMSGWTVSSERSDDFSGRTPSGCSQRSSRAS